MAAVYLDDIYLDGGDRTSIVRAAAAAAAVAAAAVAAAAVAAAAVAAAETVTKPFPSFSPLYFFHFFPAPPPFSFLANRFNGSLEIVRADEMKFLKKMR